MVSDMENLKEVDWGKAPDGATHYNATCSCPWLKETPPSYFCNGAWVEYNKFNKQATIHLRTTIKRPQEIENKEWNGESIPPIGTVCEYYWSEGDEWRKCEVVAYYLANVVAVDVFDSTAVCLHFGLSLLRPLRTPEQIEEEKRLQAIDEMNELILGWGVEKRMLAVLYDAGYRKIVVKK